MEQDLSESIGKQEKLTGFKKRKGGKPSKKKEEKSGKI